MPRTSRIAAIAGAAALALALGACTAGAPTPTETQMTEHPDDTDLQAMMREYQAYTTLERDAFYDAEPDPDADPGTLIAAEEFDGWKIPNAKAWRIVYDSVNAAGEPVATSAAVFTPWGPAPDGGWPLIAWAHGTSGVSPMCAPSLMKDLYYPEVVQAFLAEGYAVVATDYSGLGAGEGHEYVTMPANADDVRYSVPAARAAVDTIGAEWVTTGHSQGGQAAWGVAGRNSTDDAVPGLLGAAPLAPGTPLELATEAAATAPGTGVYIPYIASSVALQYDVPLEDILTEEGLAVYGDVTDNCLLLATALVGEGTIAEYLDPGFAELPAAKEFAAANVYTDTAVTVPLLVFSGQQDISVFADTVDEVVARQRATGGTVEYHSVPGDHDGMIATAMPQLLDWIAARFAGEPATDG